MSKPEIKPSRRYYILAAVVLLIGVVPPVWITVSVIASAWKPPISAVVVPGKGKVLLEKPGKYVICYEYRSIVNGRSYVTPEEFPGLECRLVSKDAGQEIPLECMFGSYNYTIGQRAGTGVWNFQVDQPGTYELQAWYPEGVEGPQELVLVVDKGFPWRIIVAGVVSALLLFICFCSAVVIFLVTLLKRISSKKRLAESVGEDAVN